MIRVLEKLWFPILVSLIIFTIISMFLWPTVTQSLAWIVIIIGTLFAIIHTANRHYEKYRNSNHDRVKLVRNVVIDVLGILLTIFLSIWLALIALALIAPRIAIAVEVAIPGIGLPSGLIAGLVITLGIGLIVGLLIRWIWRIIMKELE